MFLLASDLSDMKSNLNVTKELTHKKFTDFYTECVRLNPYKFWRLLFFLNM